MSCFYRNPFSLVLCFFNLCYPFIYFASSLYFASLPNSFSLCYSSPPASSLPGPIPLFLVCSLSPPTLLPFPSACFLAILMLSSLILCLLHPISASQGSPSPSSYFYFSVSHSQCALLTSASLVSFSLLFCPLIFLAQSLFSLLSFLCFLLLFLSLTLFLCFSSSSSVFIAISHCTFPSESLLNSF